MIPRNELLMLWLDATKDMISTDHEQKKWFDLESERVIGLVSAANAPDALPSVRDKAEEAFNYLFAWATHYAGLAGSSTEDMHDLRTMMQSHR